MESKYNVDFIPGYYYHIYNRGNNREIIFYMDDNYKYFLKRFDKYLSIHLDVLAFCLLPNHFHFLVKVKENLPG
ncbi:MAG: transposase, partial [Ignavibacteria bacterium]